MPYKFNETRRHKIPNSEYRVTNWPEYDAALVKCRSLTVWIGDGVGPPRRRQPWSPKVCNLRSTFRWLPIATVSVRDCRRRGGGQRCDRLRTAIRSSCRFASRTRRRHLRRDPARPRASWCRMRQRVLPAYPKQERLRSRARVYGRAFPAQSTRRRCAWCSHMSAGTHDPWCSATTRAADHAGI
jgi:hypothetical protein